MALRGSGPAEGSALAVSRAGLAGQHSRLLRLALLGEMPHPVELPDGS